MWPSDRFKKVREDRYIQHLDIVKEKKYIKKKAMARNLNIGQQSEDSAESKISLSEDNLLECAPVPNSREPPRVSHVIASDDCASNISVLSTSSDVVSENPLKRAIDIAEDAATGILFTAKEVYSISPVIISDEIASSFVVQSEAPIVITEDIFKLSIDTSAATCIDTSAATCSQPLIRPSPSSRDDKKYDVSNQDSLTINVHNVLDDLLESGRMIGQKEIFRESANRSIYEREMICNVLVNSRERGDDELSRNPKEYHYRSRFNGNDRSPSRRSDRSDSRERRDDELTRNPKEYHYRCDGRSDGHYPQVVYSGQSNHSIRWGSNNDELDLTRIAFKRSRSSSRESRTGRKYRNSDFLNHTAYKDQTMQPPRVSHVIASDDCTSRISVPSNASDVVLKNPLKRAIDNADDADDATNGVHLTGNEVHQAKYETTEKYACGRDFFFAYLQEPIILTDESVEAILGDSMQKTQDVGLPGEVQPKEIKGNTKLSSRSVLSQNSGKKCRYGSSCNDLDCNYVHPMSASKKGESGSAYRSVKCVNVNPLSESSKSDRIVNYSNKVCTVEKKGIPSIPACRKVKLA